MARYYELRIEVPLPAGLFNEAETIAKLKAPVEAVLKALADAKIPGLKVENEVRDRRADYQKKKAEPAVSPISPQSSMLPDAPHFPSGVAPADYGGWHQAIDGEDAA